MENNQRLKLVIIHGVSTVGKSYWLDDYATRKRWRAEGFDLVDSDDLAHALHGSWGDGPSDPERSASVAKMFDSIMRYRSAQSRAYARWYVLVTNNYAITSAYTAYVIASFGRRPDLVARMMSSRQPDLWPDAQSALNYMRDRHWTLTPLPYATKQIMLDEGRYISDFDSLLLHATRQFRESQTNFTAVVRRGVQ